MTKSDPTRVVQQYLNMTKRVRAKVGWSTKLFTPVNTNTPGGLQLLNLWEVQRKDESVRFDQYRHLSNRRLLWHGTNVAVVAAILKTGVRIMPTATSGSRVGRGIYLAPEVGKSEQYCRTTKIRNEEHGLLFLLGKHLAQQSACRKTCPLRQA
jgi:hypothetical protein